MQHEKILLQYFKLAFINCGCGILRECFLFISLLYEIFFLLSRVFRDFFLVLKGVDKMTLKERVKALADQRGISLPTLESELGFGNSTIVKWDKSTPNADKLNAVAKYFGVSMDYLLNGVDTELSAKDERDISKDLANIMAKLSQGEAGPATYDGEVLSPESADLLRDELEIALRRLKLINKEKYNPHKNKK